MSASAAEFSADLETPTSFDDLQESQFDVLDDETATEAALFADADTDLSLDMSQLTATSAHGGSLIPGTR